MCDRAGQSSVFVRTAAFVSSGPRSLVFIEAAHVAVVRVLSDDLAMIHARLRPGGGGDL